jgi:phosphatidylglycerophosphate synthase
MVDEMLRPLKERLLLIVAGPLSRCAPSLLTALGFLFGLAACAAASMDCLRLALTAWLANRVCDGLDGTCARLRGAVSARGGYLDMMADLAIYALLPIALAVGHPSPAAWLSLPFLLASFYVNLGSWMYLSALLGTPGRFNSIAMPAGWVEGTETVVFFVLFLVLPAHLALLFWLMAAAVLATAAQRVWWAARHL